MDGMYIVGGERAREGGYLSIVGRRILKRYQSEYEDSYEVDVTLPDETKSSDGWIIYKGDCLRVGENNQQVVAHLLKRDY